MTDSTTSPASPPATRRSLADRLRSRLRLVLLVGVPALAVVGLIAFYLAGGRYISTDNAYVGAPKVLITPDISGKVARVAIHEGTRVAAGDELVVIDPEPFRIAIAQAEARRATTRTELANLKDNLKAYGRQLALARDIVAIRQRDLDRKTSLLGNHAVSASDADLARSTLTTAQAQVEQLVQQEASTRNQLLGDAELPLERFPAYQQAQAALEQAQRDLAHTTLRAPIAGIATQVDNVQLGRYLTAGTAIMSIVDDRHPWIDANPKETDITYLAEGQTVDITVDSFPDRVLHGRVLSVSPGTGAQFAILPAQNASGNWVKVVQRVPVRIGFAPDENLDALRAGMSANVSIDTRRKRSLATLLGLSTVSAQPTTPR
ncbi:MAG TPA: HlyD family secretion protein [Xanthobacteraceae bacterium]|nr:HlyD family secretion protein [Xanthobacteraceae bacterium]